MKHEKFVVTGMTCSACSAHVEKSVAKVAGVSSVSVNLLAGSMVVDFDETAAGPDKIIAAVVEGGYGAELASDSDRGKQREASDKHIAWMKKRLIISIVFLVPLFYLSMGHMMGLPVPAVFHHNQRVFAVTQIALLIPILIVNISYFTVGFKRLFQLAPNMDSLVALGAAAGLVYSAMETVKIFQGTAGDMPELYFEGAGMILALVTVGKYMEARSKGKTGEAIASLIALAPESAVVVRDGREVTLPIGDVVEGDRVIVRQGGRIPVDGVVLSGSGAVDESAITGESLPVEKGEGDTVIAATINRSGYLELEASRVGKDTTLSKIISLMEEAASSKAPIAKLADKVSGVFVPTVITISVLAGLLWYFVGRQTGAFSISISIAVLVISCPCALGLATPVAIMVGTGKAAQQGILIKSAEALEILHHIDTVVMDKTGTVTEGRPRVTDVFPAEGVSREELLRLAGSAEVLSEHPLAVAIVEYAKEQQIALADASDFSATPGGGVEAVVEGRKLLAGNRRLMDRQGVELAAFDALAAQTAQEGKTPLYFVADGRLLGMLALADTVKPTSAGAIAQLKKLGIDVVLLTGDNRRTADAIGRQLDVGQVIAEVLPQDKEKCVADLQAQGRKVAMIGDGINDAPALARADVGIAIGAGTDIAIESSDVVLMKSDLNDAVAAVELSKAVIRNIKQNLFWAFFYNSIGIPIAAGLFYLPFGFKLDPMFAAAAMSLSSVCVVSNALRLRGWKPTLTKLPSTDENNKPVTINKEETTMKTMTIKGMMCAHCSGRVEKALNDLPGGTATVNLEAGTAAVQGDVSDEALTKAVTDAGYEVVAIA
ncbi:MAG: heavy metal translocating P-type ATPase [Oscillospiraceae bacterium]|nr:heavy metal translocating P-type ATPase [Oscillospiraceae bacterium]